MINHDLNPCLCGSNEVELVVGDPCGYWVECNSCGFSGCPDIREQGAIKRWNSTMEATNGEPTN